MLNFVLVVLMILSALMAIIFGCVSEETGNKKFLFICLSSLFCFVIFGGGVSVSIYIQHKEFKSRLLDVVDSYTIYLNGEETTKYETDVFSYRHENIRIVDESKEIIIFDKNESESK